MSVIASGKLSHAELVESLLEVTASQLDDEPFGVLVMVVRAPADDDSGSFTQDLISCALKDTPLRNERHGWVSTGEFPTIASRSSEPSEGDQVELLAELGDAPHCIVPLRGMHRRLTLGRSPSSDIILSDPSVSSQHAEFILEDGGIRVVDTDSKNGTSVNGRRLTPDERPWLQPMDRLLLGRIQAFVCNPRALRGVLRQDLRTLV